MLWQFGEHNFTALCHLFFLCRPQVDIHFVNPFQTWNTTKRHLVLIILCSIDQLMT